jgi:hypothetical protein
LSQSSAVKTAGEKKGEGLEDMTLWYHYPYQGSNTADKYINKPVPKFLLYELPFYAKI